MSLEGGLTARRAVWTAAIALAICLGAVLGFIGGKHQPGMTVLRGVPYVGIHEASFKVGGWAYGIQGAGNVTWVDSHGSTHTSGWPACLRTIGPHRVPITFGEVQVTSPGGLTWRQVVWVDCQSS